MNCDIGSYEWHKIADTRTELPFYDQSILRFTVNDNAICLAEVKGELYACTARCPHAGADLSGGDIDVNGFIQCPLHAYSFNIISGRDKFNEGYFLRRYPVRVEEAGIFIGMPLD